MHAEALAHDPFDPVASGGGGNFPARQRQPQARYRQAIVPGQQQQPLVRGTPGIIEDPLKLAGHPQSLLAAESFAAPGHVGANYQADSRLRPFARRALSTARPDLVFILARNPCRRCRLILLGW